jgi:hypothetical protein
VSGRVVVFLSLYVRLAAGRWVLCCVDGVVWATVFVYHLCDGILDDV